MNPDPFTLRALFLMVDGKMMSLGAPQKPKKKKRRKRKQTMDQAFAILGI